MVSGPGPRLSTVPDRIVYVTRVTRLPFIGADGADIGRVVDVVLDLGGRPPRINGFVAAARDTHRPLSRGWRAYSVCGARRGASRWLGAWKRSSIRSTRMRAIARWPSVSRPTTSSRCRSSTPATRGSVRSRSTTCSTGCFPRTGARRARAADGAVLAQNRQADRDREEVERARASGTTIWPGRLTSAAVTASPSSRNRRRIS